MAKINDRLRSTIEVTAETREAVRSSHAAAPKTAPSMVMGLHNDLGVAIAKQKAAEKKLEEFAGSDLAKRLDPKLVHASKWANRNEQSFESKEFALLKEEIKSAAGNVQAIKVRPKRGSPGEYEIVFGHRRHRACLELGITVLTLIEELTDAELFAQMDRENRQRADLRPYEQGVMYARALDDGLFLSLRKLAEAVGIEPGTASKAIALARLPEEVLNAFLSPLDLQFPWAAALNHALQKNPELVLSRARVFPQETPRALSATVFKLLTEEGVSSGNTLCHDPILVKGKSGQSGEITYNAKKKTFVISLAGVDEKRLKDIEKAIKALLS